MLEYVFHTARHVKEEIKESRKEIHDLREEIHDLRGNLTLGETYLRERERQRQREVQPRANQQQIETAPQVLPVVSSQLAVCCIPRDVCVCVCVCVCVYSYSMKRVHVYVCSMCVYVNVCI